MEKMTFAGNVCIKIFMENTRKIITENIDLFPEFQYYVDVVVLKIEENEVTHPDISIESCKSLIE
jgi:hypothetical protein